MRNEQIAILALNDAALVRQLVDAALKVHVAAYLRRQERRRRGWRVRKAGEPFDVERLSAGRNDAGKFPRDVRIARPASFVGRIRQRLGIHVGADGRRHRAPDAQPEPDAASEMDAEIAYPARAKVGVHAPQQRMVHRRIRTHRRGADPQIPVERLWNRRGHRHRPLGARPAVARREENHTPDGPDHARTQHFDRRALARAGGNLRAELRDYAAFRRETSQLRAFVHVLAQWLLAVDMLAAQHRLRRDDGVRMIRRRNIDRVEPVAFRRKKLAPVAVDTRVRHELVRVGEEIRVDVAEGGDLHARIREELLQVIPRHVRRADAGVTEPRIRRARRKNRCAPSAREKRRG